jgi:hypothetical protein
MGGISVDLGAPWLRTNSEAFAALVSNLLENLIMVNRVSLKKNPRIPELYKSGVRYQSEPDGYDSFVDVYKVLAAGHGDCAHLVAWRVAELRNKGERATIRVEWRDWKDGRPKLFHVQVRRANGSIEDPSALLGMNEP